LVDDWGEEAWLNPFNHKTLPLIGRKAELARLIDFAYADTPFLIWALIAPSGAGKTRLASHWMLDYQEKPNWDVGFLRERETTFWENWTPDRNTIIVIDYIFAFDSVIKTIRKRCKTLTKVGALHHRVRLLAIDHVFPEVFKELSRDTVWSAALDVTSQQLLLQTRSEFFDNAKPLRLSEAVDRAAVLEGIIAHRAELGLEDPRLFAAVNSLKAMGEAAQHPLFAALIGDAVRLGHPPTSLKRHELIDNYLSGGNRLPWERLSNSPEAPFTSEEGMWIGAAVSAATLRRGTRFYVLDENLPERTDNHAVLYRHCRTITSSNNPEPLPPFEPDILGENLLLRLLEKARGREDQLKTLQTLLWAEEPGRNAEEIALRFIETVQRLARNLANEDQSDVTIEGFWRALDRFLTPDESADEGNARIAVSIARAEVARILDERDYKENAGTFWSGIKPDNLQPLENQLLTMLSLSSLLHHADWKRAELDHDPTESDQFFKRFLNFYTSEPGGPLTLAIVVGLNLQKLTGLILTQLFNEIDVNRGNGNGWTALMEACYRGHDRIVEQLLAVPDIKVDSRTSDTGASALMLACRDGHDDVVQLLIKVDGINVNQGTTDNGTTALMVACHFGHSDVVRLLTTARGIDLNLGNSHNGSTALLLASKANHADVVEILVESEGIDVNQGSTKLGITALMGASHYGHIEIMRLLLGARGIDVNQGTFDNGTTALMCAAEEGHPEAVRLLLSADGINVNQTTTDNGSTAFFLACKSGNTDVQKLFLSVHDVDVNRCTTDIGATALMLACAMADIDTIKLLLSAHNIDVNRKARNGGPTALMVSCVMGRTEATRLLLNAGADVNATESDQNWSALDFAQHTGRQEIVRILLEAGAIDTTAIFAP